MPRNFDPSPESYTPEEAALQTLRYMRKAAEALEKHIKDTNELPAWVEQQIHLSARNLGMAVSYLQYAESMKIKTDDKKKRGKK